jgi:hypothetical protein
VTAIGQACGGPAIKSTGAFAESGHQGTSAAIGRSTVARMPQQAPGHHCVSRRASEFAMDRPAAIC